MQTSAAALCLPPDVRPVCPPRTTTGACHVCDRDVEFDDVRLLCCARCGVTVHTTCYCVRGHTPGESWLCEPCGAGIKAPPACALCPVAGGALRFCKGGEWVHAACAFWIPGVTMVPGELPDLASVRSCGHLLRLLLSKQTPRITLPCSSHLPATHCTEWHRSDDSSMWLATTSWTAWLTGHACAGAAVPLRADLQPVRPAARGRVPVLRGQQVLHCIPPAVRSPRGPAHVRAGRGRPHSARSASAKHRAARPVAGAADAGGAAEGGHRNGRRLAPARVLRQAPALRGRPRAGRGGGAERGA